MDPDENDMLEAVSELQERRAWEVMVSCRNVASLPAGMPLEELFSVTTRGNHTRYPIHEDDSPDRIVGAVDIRDVMRAVEAEGLKPHITACDLPR